MALSDKGYNPLRWDCEKQGCFNQKRRPKIEIFSDCFPGRISFGDIDGIVEINGKCLMLEWKTHNKPLPLGQKIMYERITKQGDITVLNVVGNAETMDISEYSLFWKGKIKGPFSCDIDSLKERIIKWVSFARRSS